MINKDVKKGIQIALDIIKKQQRVGLQWEFMAERDDGEYIEVQEVKDKLIKLLKDNP